MPSLTGGSPASRGAETPEPPCYAATDPTLLSIRCPEFEGAGSLAGGGYSIGPVDLSIRFKAEEDAFEGDY